MLRNKNYIRQFLAVLLVVYGASKILLGVKGIWFAITYIFCSSSITFISILYAVGMPFFYLVLIPASAIVGGVGLFQKKKWGWILSIIISLTIFTLHCAGTINFIIASYFYRNIPMPPIPEGAHVEHVSMIPTYIITVVSLTYILVLNSKSVKIEFMESNKNS